MKWTRERSEAFVSDYQGRDLVVKAELALDGDGRFLALRSTNLSNLGVHAAPIIPLRKGVSILNSLYRVPVCYYRAQAVLSNTPSTIPYRSEGRPEAMYVMERLIELAARKTGIDALELRRRNLISPHELPYRNPSGVTYDSGDYERSMNIALDIGDWTGFPARRAASKARGLLRGIGLANYIELTMGFPREWAGITVRPQGEVELAIGTLSSGQGHETSFAQCVSEWLGVSFESARHVQGDTDQLFSVNVKGTMLACSEFGKVMVEKKSGKVIDVSSVRGLRATLWGGNEGYCATKGAVDTMTRSLASEWAPYNINVNAIAPLLIRTPPCRAYPQRSRETSEVRRQCSLQAHRRTAGSCGALHIPGVGRFGLHCGPDHLS